MTSSPTHAHTQTNTLTGMHTDAFRRGSTYRLHTWRLTIALYPHVKPCRNTHAHADLLTHSYTLTHGNPYTLCMHCTRTKTGTATNTSLPRSYLPMWHIVVTLLTLMRQHTAKDSVRNSSWLICYRMARHTVANVILFLMTVFSYPYFLPPIE